MKSPIFDNEVWKLIKKLDSLNEKVSLQELKKDHSILDIEKALIFFDQSGSPLKTESLQGVEYISPPSISKIELSLSLSQWISLRAHFPLMEDYKSYSFHQDLKDKLEQVQIGLVGEGGSDIPTKASACYSLRDSLGKKQLSLLAKVEQASREGRSLNIVTTHEGVFSFFPCKVLLLEGELTIVGEKEKERCLISYAFSDIQDIELKSGEYKTQFSRVEIDEFIIAIRAVSGREERLVFKIDQTKEIDLNPEYHFLAHTFMTSNTEGDLIWAASVEVSSDLYDWMLSIDESIEILDPINVKTEYEKYRNIYSKNVKKAS